MQSSAEKLVPSRSRYLLRRLATTAAAILAGLVRREEGQFDSRRTNLMYLLIYGGMVLLPAAFRVNADCQGISLGSASLPATCLSQTLFHTDCPGCGLGRAFVAIGNGHFRLALNLHRISIPLYLCFAAQGLLRLWCLLRHPRPLPLSVEVAHYWVGLGLVFLLIGNWLLGLFLGGNGFGGLV